MVKLAGATAGHPPDHRRRPSSRSRPTNCAPPSPRARGCSSSTRPATRPARVYTPDEIKALGDVCVEKGVLIMSDEIYEHLLYDGAKVTERGQLQPGPLRAHHHRARLRQGLEHDRLAAGFPGRARSRSPRPSTPSRATAPATRPRFAQKGARGRAHRAAGPPAKSGWPNTTKRRTLRLAEAQQHPRHLLRERQGRVLPLPEHLRHRPQVRRVLRPAARSRRKSPPCPASPSAPTTTSASATPPAWRTSRRAWTGWSKFARSLAK